MTREPKAIEEIMMNDGKKIKIYYTSNCFGCGVSLGNYIILDYKNYYGAYAPNTYNHEHGHQKQSLYLGWLYLIAVGLVSAIGNNLWDRTVNKYIKKWNNEKRIKWYYNRYPEKWADKLGGVKRFDD